MNDKIISRERLFRRPQKDNAQISPDGKYLSWVALHNEISNIWIAPISNLKDKILLTHSKVENIRVYEWSKNSEYLLYKKDNNGDENWEIYAVNIYTKKEMNLIDSKGVSSQIVKSSWLYPKHIVVALNSRDPYWHDMYKVDITSGKKELLIANTEGFNNYFFDEKLNVRLASKILDDGSSEFFMYENGTWKVFKTIAFKDSMSTYISHIHSTGEDFYIVDSSNHNTSALIQMNLNNNTRTVLGHSDKADVSDLLLHPVTYEVEAWERNYLKAEWQILSKSIEGDFAFLQNKFSQTPKILSRTKADDIWIILVSDAQNPGVFWLYNRTEQSLVKILERRPTLNETNLLPMHSVVIQARDGLRLPSYLTLPSDVTFNEGRASKSVPMVLLVHGGPYGRDSYGFDTLHQWLANRGYAVLTVNFRASIGFGKEFINKGNLQWSKKMHDDLIDAVDWAIENGVTPKDKVAIMGDSYGGYATLVGLTFTPDVFCCGVEHVGISDLETLLKSIPPYWKSILNELIARVGNPFTKEGIRHLKECSPIYKVQNITKPLLIAHGENDVRVKQEQAEKIVNAMKENNLPVTYVLYPNEGHLWSHHANIISYLALAENFFAEHLGGVAEPIGDAINNSSAKIIEV